jgi:hypothetical protein
VWPGAFSLIHLEEQNVVRKNQNRYGETESVRWRLSEAKLLNLFVGAIVPTEKEKQKIKS